MAEHYFRLMASNVHSEEEDSFVHYCVKWGAQGVAEDLEFEQLGDQYEPVTRLKSRHVLNVYFLKWPGETFLLQIKSRFPHIELKFHEEPNRDWLAEWKKGFKPFILAGGHWVVPSWEPIPPEAKKIIRIDPGMAFGTGTHATTQLAAGLMVDHIKDKTTSLIDVGTGTGILAMLANQLGVSHIVATEIDPTARNVARENVKINQLPVSVVDESADKIDESFDWVVANIIDGVLLNLQDILIARLKKPGRLLLTGILQEREKQFLERWRHPMAVVERRQQDEWIGFLLEMV